MNPDTWSAVDDFLSALLLPHDPALTAALADSHAANLPAINVSPTQGKLLHLLALTLGAQRILEIGTLGGYSAIWLARALPPTGRLITLELNPAHARVAHANLARAGLADKVDIRVGPALSSLAALPPSAPFDLVFIDADKPNNSAYFQHALRLTRPGGLILIDNIIRKGAILDPHDTDPAVQGTRQVLQAVAAEPRVSATALQTVGAKGYDGLLLVRVNDH